MRVRRRVTAGGRTVTGVAVVMVWGCALGGCVQHVSAVAFRLPAGHIFLVRLNLRLIKFEVMSGRFLCD